MAGRTAREILADRERELTSELASLNQYTNSLEDELRDVRRAIEALGVNNIVVSDSASANIISVESSYAHFKAMTINELVLDALDVHFVNGASHAMLREVFRDIYKRNVEQGSLRSQLARLKAMGLIKEASAPGVLELTPRGAAQAQNERRKRLLELKTQP